MNQIEQFTSIYPLIHRFTPAHPSNHLSKRSSIMRKILSLTIIFQFAFAQEAQVTNVTAAQRTDGSKQVDITYDLTEDTLFTFFIVNIEVSFDGGVTYTPTNYVTGDCGMGIGPGIGKVIVWRAKCI